MACSNDKYVLDNLKNRLQEVNEEKTNMQMVLDFHLSELEDKKLKVSIDCSAKESVTHFNVKISVNYRFFFQTCFISHCLMF